MFLGSLTDFIFPDFIGKIITAMTEKEWDEVDDYIWKWLVIILATAFASFLRDFIFAIASERLGLSLRQKLYDTIIRKDISFFDNNRTGDILSRLGSDTQVVSDGLTTAVAQTVRATTILVGVFVIMFRINWILTLILCAALAPNIFATRISLECNRRYAVNYQKAKAGMCSYAEETISCIRTVKAFSDEDGAIKNYRVESGEVFKWGDQKARIWGVFMA